ncbi:hypothetical protein BD779DRAFT_1477644 [Infundibulicybe gibba]|nr:hypothetical protein BD779DRAFT_1477644 [Infundibulicybe gibba]
MRKASTPQKRRARSSGTGMGVELEVCDPDVPAGPHMLSVPRPARHAQANVLIQMETGNEHAAENRDSACVSETGTHGPGSMPMQMKTSQGQIACEDLVPGLRRTSGGSIGIDKHQSLREAVVVVPYRFWALAHLTIVCNHSGIVGRCKYCSNLYSNSETIHDDIAGKIDEYVIDFAENAKIDKPTLLIGTD